MAGAKVTAEAAQRELWGPGIGDVAGFQKRILCQKKMFISMKDTISGCPTILDSVVLSPLFFIVT